MRGPSSSLSLGSVTPTASIPTAHKEGFARPPLLIHPWQTSATVHRRELLRHWCTCNREDVRTRDRLLAWLPDGDLAPDCFRSSSPLFVFDSLVVRDLERFVPGRRIGSRSDSFVVKLHLLEFGGDIAHGPSSLQCFVELCRARVVDSKEVDRCVDRRGSPTRVGG